MNKLIIESTVDTSSLIKRNSSTSILKSVNVPLEKGENIIYGLDYGFYFDYTCQNENIEVINLDDYDTTHITDMDFMFCNCLNVKELNVNNFNTSNVVGASFLFSNCINLSSLCLVRWDTSKMKYMNFMFYNCRKIKVLDLSSFDTSNVRNMCYMFGGCNDLVSLDLSNFDISNVIYINDMFYNCESLTYITCKQSFKDFCIQNQDNIVLPESMRDGGNGIWDIID